MMAKVGVVLGSDSDLPVMAAALETLEELQVPCELKILSAHRTPDKAAEYARTAALRGLEVLVAAAGMAAHLPGVLAAYTVLPVIGVPLRSPGLEGLDALYAMVQVPPGVPVATVGLNAARNAALLAGEIVALKDPAVAERLAGLRRQAAEQIEAKNARLAEAGWRKYLESTGK
ncbi:MAG: 5-(carboxyamino)imidazole ribonucleotide mutase [Clostridia bacterium]|nr:MAG: 5-(carboxyamino)imidazole ribonucleotide mutase [Clostridia bacterium]